MAMSVGDIIKVTLCQELFSQRVCNIFYYKIDEITGVPGLGLLLDVFFTNLVTDLNAIQTNQVNNVSLRADNLTNGLDFEEQDISGSGGVTVDNAFSPMASFGYKLVPDQKGVRSGGKRFAGVGETSVTDGKISDPDALVFAALADEINAPLVGLDGGDSVTATPIIVGRTATGSLDLSRTRTIRSAVINPNVTTQNSRKFGRGV